LDVDGRPFTLGLTFARRVFVIECGKAMNGRGAANWVLWLLDTFNAPVITIVIIPCLTDTVTTLAHALPAIFV
jgi:hypothetical protein